MKKHKLLAGITAIVISLGAMPVSTVGDSGFDTPFTAIAIDYKGIEGAIYDGTTDDGFKYEVYGTYDLIDEEKKNIKYDHVVIKEYIGKEHIVTVPKTVDKIPVTEMYETFFRNTTVTTVTIQDNITTISDHVFEECSNLVKVVIPKSVKTIQNSAFANCTKLVSADIPDSVITIGDGAFKYCESLPEVNIPNSVTAMGDGVFSGCTALTDVTMTDSVLTIGKDTFSGCSNLVKVKLSDSLTSLGSSFFGHCESLTTIELPSKLKTIDEWAFGFCTKLNSIKIPDTVKTIGNGAFNECTSLTEITLSKSLTAISSWTFQQCYELRKVTIPDSVTTIGENAFKLCHNLNSVTIPKSVTSIGKQALGYGDDGFKVSFDTTEFTIYGYKDTAAETYAKENEIKFIDLDAQPLTDKNYRAGDANADGEVDLSDVVMIMQALANPNRYGTTGTDEHHITAQGVANADVIGNNGMTTEDAGTIQRYLLKLIPSIPVTE